MRQLSLMGREEKTFWDNVVSGKFANMVREESKGNELNSAQEVYNVMKPIFAKDDDIEKMYCIFMDGRNRVISIDEMTKGTINHAAVYPREIVKMALKKKASSIVLTHNHPSGYLEPSNEDKQLTMKVGLSISAIDIQLHDHIIVGNGYMSFSERGLMNPIKDRVNQFMAAIR